MPGTDPDPDRTTGLEPGGSVPPGETPPGETSSTEGLGRLQPDLPSRGVNWAVMAVIVGLALAVAGFFVVQAVLR